MKRGGLFLSQTADSTLKGYFAQWRQKNYSQHQRKSKLTLIWKGETHPH